MLEAGLLPVFFARGLEMVLGGVFTLLLAAGLERVDLPVFGVVVFAEFGLLVLDSLDRVIFPALILRLAGLADEAFFTGCVPVFCALAAVFIRFSADSLVITATVFVDLLLGTEPVFDFLTAEGLSGALLAEGVFSVLRVVLLAVGEAAAFLPALVLPGTSDFSAARAAFFDF